ncbi:MAG TPA: thioredoxin domain-containing protein [Alphaproteobacteria bacterium]|nr:thioredoxin domain-containing protein [Alphaproteobacteria bacterium]
MRAAFGSASLLPFMVAGVLVLLALNLVHTMWEWWGSDTMQTYSTQTSGGRNALGAPRQVDAPAFGHNLQFGNAGAAATLTIFTDPACAPCRAKVQQALGQLSSRMLGSGVRIVYKFWPLDKQNLSGGLVTEIARREGLATPFMKALEQQPAAQGDDLLAVLESAGLPLARQQDWLKNKTYDLIENVSQDISQGQNLGLGSAPQFILNGYLLEDTTLPVNRLASYITRIQTGDPIVQPSDYWLNP